MSGEGGLAASSPKDPFEDRLHQARQRQGLEASPPAKAGGAGSGMGIGLRAGVELVSAEAVAGALGWGLDRLLHTLPLFLIVFVVLGGVAGIVNVWRLLPPPGPSHER